MKTNVCLLLCLFALTTAAVAQTSTTAPSAATSATSESLRDYAGTYTFASGSPISNYTITVKDGELYGDAGMGTYKLIKQDAVDQYKSTSSYGSIISFVRDASTKQVTGLSLAAQGQQLNATKDK
ncbi:DUF3471 domain-containing protein [Fibrella sp. WM1]|uniref:DUF3471 domain-containing protein n=1 Tax=Fibrella musci TaxID=3242485 RepID=UPI003521C36A